MTFVRPKPGGDANVLHATPPTRVGGTLIVSDAAELERVIGKLLPPLLAQAMEVALPQAMAALAATRASHGGHVSIQACARELAIHERTVTRLIAKGLLRAVKVGGRTLIPRESVAALTRGGER